jgi:hypothetical protein
VGVKNFTADIPGTGRTVRVRSISMGQDPRGFVHGPHRPDYVRHDNIQTFYQRIRSLCAERADAHRFDWAERFEKAMKNLSIT